MILPYEKLKDYRGIVSMVDGGFDPIHSGHLAYFRAARSLGYPLLCNVCPDSDTSKKHSLLLPAIERAEILSHLDILTYVHVSERPTHEILRELQPAYYVKGDDWIDNLPKEIGQVCDELGIRIRYTATKTRSSSALLAQFQPDVDAFEELVQSQKPADKPWEPTAAVPYDLESRRKAEGDHPRLIKEVFAPKKVLDVGCGPGHLMTMLEELGVKCQGLDKSASEIVIWKRIVQWDIASELDNGDWGHTLRDKFAADLVINREMCEHLTIREIPVAIRNLCALSKRFVYLTTRFNQSRHFLDFATSDGLDPTHISIMPKDWLRHLFVLEGFRRRADLEERMDHRNLGRVLVYERSAGC